MEKRISGAAPSVGRRFLGFFVVFLLGGMAGAALILAYGSSDPNTRLAGWLMKTQGSQDPLRSAKTPSFGSQTGAPSARPTQISEPSSDAAQGTQGASAQGKPSSRGEERQASAKPEAIDNKSAAAPLRPVDLRSSPEDFLDPAISANIGADIALTDTVLLNGGGQPESNYFSHHLFLEMLHELLPRRGFDLRRLTVFSTDGESPEADRLIVKNVAMDWLYEGLNEHQMVVTSLMENTTMKGQKLHPAKRSALARWFRGYARKAEGRTKPSTLFLFVTDHGTKGKGPLGNKIELWRENVDVRQLRTMMEPLGKRNRVVTVMSQCYSGGFANVLYESPGKVHGNRCGFFSTIASREAYGCFPETARSSRTGHAYHMIHAMQTAQTFAEAHRRTLLTDDAPDVPLATSDVYLEDRLRSRARGTGRRLAVEADRWLAQVDWKRPRLALRADIRLLRRLEKRFGVDVHTRTAQIWEAIRANRAAQKQLQKLEGLWEQVLGEMRRGAMVRFYQAEPTLAATLEKEMNRTGLDEQTFGLGRQLHTAYLRHLKGKRDEVLLKQLYQRHGLVSKKVFHLHVKEAALLRVHTLLLRIAGRTYLASSGSAAERGDLQSLLRCESTSLGGRKVTGVLQAEGPDKREDIDPLKVSIARDAPNTPVRDLIPSQLGIAFQPTAEGWHPRFSRLAPGAVVVNEVAEASPAEQAGLRVGDTIVSLGGQMLQLNGEIRLHVMLAKAGQKIYFMVHRAGKFLTIPVVLRPISSGAEVIAQAPPEDRSQAQPPTFPEERSTPQIPSVPEETEPEFEEDTRPQKVDPYRLPPRQRGQQQSALRDMRGADLPIPAKGAKATLLFFWATWCEGCKTMVPMLRDLEKRYAARGLKIYAVTSDEISMLRPFLRQWGARFPFQVALDVQGRLARKYNISSIPQLILYDATGAKKLHISRPSAGFEQRLARQIGALVR
ncbi:redoxin domain-containing protein [Myxococcota bacterium]|nr:redoxin domain-containing protein [Myxococcota bacterium]